MENNYSEITFFGFAQKSDKPRVYGILRVVRRKGERLIQEWTGEEFKRLDAAQARLLELNRELAATDPTWRAIMGQSA